MHSIVIDPRLELSHLHFAHCRILAIWRFNLALVYMSLQSLLMTGGLSMILLRTSLTFYPGGQVR